MTRYAFEWRLPRLIRYRAADYRPFNAALFRYPGVVIGVEVQIRRTVVSLTWGAPGRRITEEKQMNKINVQPVREESTGNVGYYRTPFGSWHGSDYPHYLSAYVHATGDPRAAAVLEYLVAQMPWWQRIWWRFTHRHDAAAPRAHRHTEEDTDDRLD